MTDIPRGVLPTDRQLAYLRYLLSQAHRAGLPYVPIWAFSRADADQWIEYLQGVVSAQAAIDEMLKSHRGEPTLQTPPRDQWPEGSRPPWEDLPPAPDHEHLVGTITREDGAEQSVCALCGVSA